MTDRIIAFLILCLMFSLPFGVAVIFTGEVMLNFVFFWPLFMSALWISGGVYFWFYRERHWKWGDDTPPPTLEGNPLVSILIPCFNEGINARETIEAALAQRYKNIEVIAINDGSTDDTHDVLEQLAVEYPSLRVIHLAENQGKALAEVGYWSPDMITEDIDISWKLQLRHWSVFFEPRALCWILMPETLKGLWKQRLRWAQGGAEVFIVNMRRLWSWEFRRMWPLFLEFCFSTAWSFAYAISIVLFLLGLMIPMPDSLYVQHLFPPAFTGLILGVVCLLQFAVSLMIERRYEKGIGASLFWIIWFPVVYWMLSLFTTLVSFPKVMLKRKRGRARWVSPDRGIGRIES